MNEVNRLLHKKGLSQGELAAHLGVSRQMITSWTIDRTHTYLNYMPEIAQFLGTTAEELLEFEERPVRIEDPDGLILERILRTLEVKNLSAADLTKFLHIKSG
ncbi:MAG: helix-turn-helix domain-containing protein, partial [Clostridiales bacterium]|nr:helix-turn-helix domain-containing protein [Clostridiales bacterium]